MSVQSWSCDARSTSVFHTPSNGGVSGGAQFSAAASVCRNALLEVEILT